MFSVSQVLFGFSGTQLALALAMNLPVSQKKKKLCTTPTIELALLSSNVFSPLVNLIKIKLKIKRLNIGVSNSGMQLLSSQRYNSVIGIKLITHVCI